MDSAIRPREIQARIRSGESLADVAERAGVPPERIEVYATPVYAERGHIAALAMSASARRRGDATVHRTLSAILGERLRARGVDLESVDWDAWKLPDRRWRVEARYAGESPSCGAQTVVALFTFDPAGRFSLAANDEARWLLGELSTTRADERRVRDEDGEPTVDLDDEFALVRALGRNSRDQQGKTAAREDEALDQQQRSAEPEPNREHEAASDGSAASDTSAAPGSSAASGPRQAEPEPTPGASTLADVYDVLPTPESELDALYEMLGGFNEDSVNIYAGLTEPVTEPAPEPVAQPEPAKSDPEPEADELEQPSLIEDDASPAPARKPRANKKRASIPSWDEIMFGGPKP